MRVGIPRETKVSEYRVGLVPGSVSELVAHGHTVIIERGAGVGSGFSDQEYLNAGAEVSSSAKEPWLCDLIVKVKEPSESERATLCPGQVLFAYLHLAPDREQTNDLLMSGATCIAYETVTSPSGGLPLLTPMSEVAGRLAPQVGAHYLEKSLGGRGVLLGGVPGVPGAGVLIIGGGVSGTQAAKIALGMGASVVVVDKSLDALRRIDDRFGGRVRTASSNRAALSELTKHADLVIGAVLVPGAAAPKVVTHEMIRGMRPGSVVVDIAIDQGGCIETARPTSHTDPVYIVDEVIHYCVTNMPGAVPRTSTLALNSATLTSVLALADKGWRKALADDPHLLRGLNVHAGKIFCSPVGEAQGRRLHPYAEAFL